MSLPTTTEWSMYVIMIYLAHAPLGDLESECGSLINGVVSQDAIKSLSHTTIARNGCSLHSQITELAGTL
jgi:hypothetical protein